VNDFGAFVPVPRARLEPTASGPLDGLTFGVKDLIDVAGHVTGAGNPDWAARQVPAARSAPVVERLLRAGATLVGKTITDELGFSLEGENHHYGTPLNPRAPDRLPGGSSSGSAVAVAAGLADLALGTDTGGSVRVPASFCGVYGYRPSHGRLSLDGVVPLAPSYDTVGLFARTAEYLHAAAHCLIGAPAVQSRPPRLLLATDALALAEPDAAAALRSAALRLGVDEEVEVFDKNAADFLDAYVTLQGLDIADALGSFLATDPRFGPTIRPRFDGVRGLDRTQGLRWRAWRKETSTRLHAMMLPGTFLLMPSAPTTAPRRFLRGEKAGRFYDAALTLCSVAGHVGLPAVNLPMVEPNDCPLGLSLLAGRGEDEGLLAAVVNLA
jgi:amidase